MERLFVKEGIKLSEVEEFLREKFEKTGYSHTDIERTPLGTRITIYVHKPGLVIGRSGRIVDELTEEIKEKFNLENPLIDVREVEQPFLDANIVSRRIARALERGINYKKVCNYYLDQVMQAGAIGITIMVSGKLSGSGRSRFKKFNAGFVAHSGDYAEKLVDKGYAQAMLRPGIVGVQVKIMKTAPIELREKLKEFKSEKPIQEKEEGVGSSKEKADKGNEA